MSAEGNLRASVILEVHVPESLPTYPDRFGVTYERDVDLYGGWCPSYRFFGTRDALRAMVRDQWDLVLSFAEGAPTLVDVDS